MVTRVSSARRAYIALGVVLASVATVALAATFNLFQPAAGILKGNPSTYVTTAATSADVIATFSGTCNSGAVLKGDGTCAAASTGTVTSVALTAPTGLTVTGSPVTTSGTLALSTTLSGVVHGNGTGFTAGNVALGSEVSGTLPVGNGGTGAGTLSGVLKGNGTSAFTSAVASDVYGLWAGGCSSSNFLRGDGTCASPGGGGTVTSITAGTGIALSPSPITATGSVSINTAVVPQLGTANTFTAQQVLTGGSDMLQLRANATNGFMSLYNSAGSTRVGYLNANVFGTQQELFGDTGFPLVLGSNGTTQIKFDTDGSWDLTGTTPGTSGQVLTSNGASSAPSWQTQPSYTNAHIATFVFAAGGCGTSPSGVSACTRNSQGSYTITLSPGISAGKCTANADSNTTSPGVRIAYTHFVSFTSVAVHIADGAGSVQDSDFNVVCWE